jgi:hypothetical protein
VQSARASGRGDQLDAPNRIALLLIDNAAASATTRTGRVADRIVKLMQDNTALFRGERRQP